MIEVARDKSSCRECGMDVRADTVFCYSCGSRLGDDPTAELVTDLPAEVNEEEAALAYLSDSLKIEEPAPGKIALASAERKRARFRGRTPSEYTWEPVDDASTRTPLMLAILITAISAGIVFLAVVWR